jgi:Tol biopolymer transport system component
MIRTTMDGGRGGGVMSLEERGAFGLAKHPRVEAVAARGWGCLAAGRARSLVGAVVLTLVAGVSSYAPAGTAKASVTFPGHIGKIAVVVTDPRDVLRPTNVMTMSRTGSHRRLITHTRTGRDSGPTNVAFSPDGRRIVFDQRACGDTCHSSVGLMSSSGYHRHLITHRSQGFDTNFGFSPDGSRVGFTRDGDLFVAGAHGGRAKRMTHYGIGVAANNPGFSPDGKRILFSRFEASYRDGVAASSETVCIIAIASREQTCVADGSSPQWAPNGRAILFTDADGSGISRMGPDGSERKRLISGPRLRPMAVAPNGRHFAFLRETANGRTLFVAKSDGTRRRAIMHDTNDFEASIDMAFSPDARQVVYRRDARTRLYLSRIDGSHDTRIRVTPQRLEGPSGSLAWAPSA